MSLIDRLLRRRGCAALLPLTIAFFITLPGTATAQNLVGHWAFNGNQSDATGKNRLHSNGIPAYAGADGSADALDLRGGNSSVTIPNSPGLQTNQFTVSAWIYTSAVQGSTAVVSKGTAWQVKIVPGVDSDGGPVDGQSLQFCVGDVCRTSTPISPDPPNRWMEIAFSYDGVTASGYADDTLIVTFAGQSHPATNNSDIQVGASPNGNRDFNGLLRELSIFNTALTPTMISRQISQEVSRTTFSSKQAALQPGTFDSSASVTVPNVIGQTLPNATSTLTGASLTVGAVTTAVSATGLNHPQGEITDLNQNVYISDTGNNLIKEWVAATGQLVTLPITGLNQPTGLGIDLSGNLYIADTGNNAIKVWNLATNQLTTLVSTGLNAPQGVVVQRQFMQVAHQQALTLVTNGDVYIADTGNNAIKVWQASTQTVQTLSWATGLNHPTGIGFGAASGSVFVADTGNNAVQVLSLSTNTMSTLACDGHGDPCEFNQPVSVVASSYVNNGPTTPGIYVIVATNSYTFIPFDDLYIVDASTTLHWWDSQSSLMESIAPPTPFSFNQPVGVVSDGNNNVWVLDDALGGLTTMDTCRTTGRLTFTCGIQDQLTSLVRTVAPGTVVSSNPAAGGSSVPSNSAVNLTIDGGTAGLSASTLLTGSAGGSTSVFLAFRSGWPATPTWTATANDSFLHVSPASSSGAASGAIAFTIDAFTGTGSRTGTLTIAGLTFTVTQVGTDYMPAYPGQFTTQSTGVVAPTGVVVDGSDNVYITTPSAIGKWSVPAVQLPNLISSGLTQAASIAQDGYGNLYIGQSGSSGSNGIEVQKWNAVTQQLTTLVSGTLTVSGVAVDNAGNVYFSETGTSPSIKEWSASTGTVSALVSTGIANNPSGVALDGSGNVYFSDTANGAVKVWNASTHQVASLISGLTQPWGLAVDSVTGDVYVADHPGLTYEIKKWTAATQSVAPVISQSITGTRLIRGLAMDVTGNLFLAENTDKAIAQLSKAWVSSGNVSEPATAGSDSLPPVIPTTTNLTGANVPTSDQTWLTIGSVTNGAVSFSFTANATGALRTGHITILGIAYTVNQQGQVAVPNVVGQTQAAASTAIIGAGLVVGNVTTSSSGTVTAGNVISSNPAAGTQVNPGSTVNLVVSTGLACVSNLGGAGKAGGRSGGPAVTLSWSGIAQAATYAVLRSTSLAGPFGNVGIPTAATAFTDRTAGMINGGTYYYELVVLDGTGATLCTSNQTMITIP